MIQWNLTLKDEDKNFFKKSLIQTVFFMVMQLITTSLIFYYSNGLSKFICGGLILFNLIYGIQNILFWKMRMNIASSTIANYRQIKNGVTTKIIMSKITIYLHRLAKQNVKRLGWLKPDSEENIINNFILACNHEMMHKWINRCKKEEIICDSLALFGSMAEDKFDYLNLN